MKGNQPVLWVADLLSNVPYRPPSRLLKTHQLKRQRCFRVPRKLDDEPESSPLMRNVLGTSPIASTIRAVGNSASDCRRTHPDRSPEVDRVSLPTHCGMSALPAIDGSLATAVVADFAGRFAAGQRCSSWAAPLYWRETDQDTVRRWDVGRSFGTGSFPEASGRLLCELPRITQRIPHLPKPLASFLAFLSAS